MRAVMPNRASRRVSDLIEQGLDYWDSKRAGRRMPARRDIEPTEIHDLLPYAGFNRWIHNYRDTSMPLSEDNDVVNMIFGVLRFEI